MKSYLGDAVMAEPTLRALAGGPLFVATSPAARQTLGHLAFEFRPLPVRPSIATLRDDVRALRRFRPETILVINRSFRAALVARLANAPIRVGHACDARRFLLTDALRYDESRYEARCYADLAEAAGISIRDVSPRLPADPRRMPEGAVGIQAGARYAGKRLPETAVREFIEALTAAGRSVFLLGGHEEREACERVANPSCTLLAGECTIAETLAALTGLSAFVSADTGLGHLAFGVRTPSLAVFGPTRMEKWSHGPPQIAVRAQGGDVSRLSAAELHSSFSALDLAPPARMR